MLKTLRAHLTPIVGALSSRRRVAPQATFTAVWDCQRTLPAPSLSNWEKTVRFWFTQHCCSWSRLSVRFAIQIAASQIRT